MSERPTIGLFKEKIAHARQLAEKIGDGRRLDEPPPSLFDDRQLERWQAAEPIITSTVVKVMKDQGFSNFDLQQDWSRAAKELSFKQVDFTLIFSKGEDGTGEDRQIKFRFDAGGRRFKNWVSARTALAVPRGYSFSEEFKLEKVLGKKIGSLFL